MMNEALPDFFSDPSVIADPRAYFDQMRARCPVARESYHGALMVTGYDQIMDVLSRRDDTFSSAVSVLGPIPALPFKAQGDDISDQLEVHRGELPWSAHLASFDGKRHTELRYLLTTLLSYTRIRQNETYLRGLTDKLIDGFINQGTCNIVLQYAHATTTYAISDLMGIPEEDRAELLQLIGAPPSQIGGDAVHKVGADPLVFLKERFDQYLRARQANPGSDLLSELANARLKDGTVADFDTLSCLARFTFGAGQDTTSRLIAMAVRILAEDPSLQAGLRNEPGRVPIFLEEVLRYDAPVKVIYRLARRKTSVGGMDVPAGTVLALCLTAGSNDPTHFDRPQEFLVDRRNVRDNIAFSRGIHACPGAPLGRLESKIAIERLLGRTADIRISERHHGPPTARQYRYEPTYSFRSLSDLYVEIRPAEASN
jgi:cytochrome P450